MDRNNNLEAKVIIKVNKDEGYVDYEFEYTDKLGKHIGVYENERITEDDIDIEDVIERAKISAAKDIIETSYVDSISFLIKEV